MSISASGMIDRASAEISKCIMRIKRKDNKKPPEVPPKPTNSQNNSMGNNGSTSPASSSSQQSSASNSQSGIPVATNPTSSQYPSFNNADMIRNGMVPVLPSTSPAPRVGGFLSSSSSGPSGIGSPNNSIITGNSSGSGSNTTPLTPRKFMISSGKKNSLSGSSGTGTLVGLLKGTSVSGNSSNSSNSTTGRFGSNSSRTSSLNNGNILNSVSTITTPEQLWQDDEFLKYLLLQFFTGSEKLVLPLVCKKWRDVCYSHSIFWNSDLIPILKCKELRRLANNSNNNNNNTTGGTITTISTVTGNGSGNNNNHVNNGGGGGHSHKNEHNHGTGAGLRRRFYAGLVKRGFTSLRLDSATDEDADDVLIHFSQGAQLIQSLKITSSSLTDKGIYNLLDHLISLKQLELSSCNELTEDGIINALPKKLEKLVIYDCIHVADLVVSFVAKSLPYLSDFTLQAYHVTDSAMMAFNQKTNSSLIKLKLDSCWELTNQTVLHIVSGLPTLTQLSLSGCSKITDEGIEILAENLTHLRSLDLSWGPRISDTSLECIACDLVCLEELILDRCTLITDLGVGYLATMSTLKKLSLRWCNIRDVSVHHIVGMRKLQFLSLAGCVSISPSTLCSLSTLRSLKELELTNCGATFQVLQFLKNTLNCVIIE